jgi:hypothetical protein
MTTKEFLESYGGKLFSKRIKHIDKMEGYKTQGYIPNDSSGITIGYGIDLGFQTVDSLVGLGIDKKTAELWDEKGYLGKLYKDFEIEGKNPTSIAMSVSIPTDEGLKNKLAENIFIKADKHLEKYQGKVSDDVYASLTTLHHFSGGFGKISDKEFEDKNAFARKSHASARVFKAMDDWLKDNPDQPVPNRLVYEVYKDNQAALKASGSPDNSNTFKREAGYVGSLSVDIKQDAQVRNKRSDKGENKTEKKEKPNYSGYYKKYIEGFDAEDPLEGVEFDDIEDEEIFPTSSISLDSKLVDKIDTKAPTTGIIDKRGEEPADWVKAEFKDWLADNPGGTWDEFNKKDEFSEAGKYADLRGKKGLGEESFLDKVGGLSSLIGLASGAIGLGQALKDVDIPKDPKLGPAFQQRLSESKRLAKQGLTPSELAKAHNDLDSSYATGIENIVRGSAGNRAQFMAGLGGLDVARQSALMDIAVADASMQRGNQQKYDSMMMVNEQYEAARQAKYQDAQYQQDSATKAAGAALAGSAFSMVNEAVGSRHINRYNKLQSEKLLMDMGYKSTKDGKSGQDQVGTDVTTGEKVTAFLSRAKDKVVGVKNKTLNLLSADDQAINTNISNQPANQNQGNNLINTSPLNNTSSGLINNPNNQVNLGNQMYDIFNTGY